MVRDTQRDAYDSIRETAAGKRLIVFKEIQECSSTMFEIAIKLRWPINRISGRITELCKLGLVRDSGERRINPASGRNVIVWEKMK
jgi:hypothetical protein